MDFTRRMGRAGVLAVVAVLILIAAPARAPQPASVTILFDLGDGTYYWSAVTIPDPAAPNASWNATLGGASMHGLSIEWTWYACCGVAVQDVGNRNPPAGFVGLYVWNATAESWDFAPVGISSFVLKPGDAIAWYNAAFDSQTFEGRFPVPTPDHPYPALEFRGDVANSGGSASEAPNGATILWDRDTGATEIGSTPAVAYGRVYVSTMKGLFALDEDSGQILWTNPVVKGMSSPAVFDGTLLVGGSDGRAYRVNATDGAERWNATLLGQTGFSGITSSPKVDFDRVYVGTFNESGGPGEVVALWTSNGTVAWRHATGSVHFSSPAVVDGTVYVGVMGRYNTTTQITFDPPYGVLALDAQTGAERWFFPTGGSVAASPLVDGPRVLAPAKDGLVYAIDRATGTELWRANVGAGVSSAAIRGGTIFVGGGVFGASGRLVALNGTTGAVRWSFTPNGPVQASVTYADGKVFFSTNTAEGTVYALNATSGEVVWAYVPSPAQFILGSPVVADGTLFAPSDNGHVYAIRDSADAPLVSLNATAPSEVPAGAEADVAFAVRAVHGRATNARLTVVVPDSLPEVSSSPDVTRRTGTTLEWDLGAIPFSGERVVTLRVRAASSAAPGPVTVASSLSYADDEGAPYPLMERSSTIRVVVASAPAFPWLPVGLLAMAVIAAGVVAVVLIRRRRSRNAT